MPVKELPVAPIVAKAEESLEQMAAAINSDHKAGEAAAREGLQHFRAAGERLLQAKAAVKCRGEKWLPWLEKNVKFSARTVTDYMRLARGWDKISAAGAADLRDALRLLTAADEDQEEPGHITLGEWQMMRPAQRRGALAADASESKFNAQGDNENIEWALWSWNPVTGCEHNCPYCYARDIAERFYEPKFEPSVWPARLHAPANTPFPEAKAAEWMGHKNVFACSMADLFGRWVPREWIDAVLAAARATPWWNFLFLTKFPVRMAEFEFPENAWVGTTVDCQARVANAERSFRKVKAPVKWLSCEPLIDPLRFADIGAFDWVVIGGASRSSATPEWVPPYRWVADLTAAAWAAGAKVYQKSNLGLAKEARVREYPGVEGARAIAPEPLRYLVQVEAKK